MTTELEQAEAELKAAQERVYKLRQHEERFIRAFTDGGVPAVVEAVRAECEREKAAAVARIAASTGFGAELTHLRERAENFDRTLAARDARIAELEDEVRTLTSNRAWDTVTEALEALNAKPGRNDCAGETLLEACQRVVKERDEAKSRAEAAEAKLRETTAPQTMADVLDDAAVERCMETCWKASPGRGLWEALSPSVRNGWISDMRAALLAAGFVEPEVKP